MTLFRFVPCLLLVLVSFVAQAQYREFFSEYMPHFVLQSDSVYKVSKVKTLTIVLLDLRTDYKKGKDGKVKETFGLHKKSQPLLVTFDEQGRIQSMAFEPGVNGQQKTTYYVYGENGQISSMRDQVLKTEHTQFLINFYGRQEAAKMIKEIPDREVRNYTIDYGENGLKKMVRLNEQSQKLMQADFSKGGLIRKLREYNKNPDGDYIATTWYRSMKGYALLPDSIYHRFGSSVEDDARRFAYLTDDDGLIVQRVHFAKYSEEFLKYTYNEKKLIFTADGEQNLSYEYTYYP